MSRRPRRPWSDFFAEAARRACSAAAALAVIALAAELFSGRCAAPALAASGRILEDLQIPGTADFGQVAKDVLDVMFDIDPSVAANAGLFADAQRVPSYAPDYVGVLEARLNTDLGMLREMPWRSWPVDQQIDFRWIFANAELARRELLVERMYTHRMAQWLEPTANTLVALATYDPADLDAQAAVVERIPPMVAQMRALATQPTRRDVTTAIALIDALTAMLSSGVDAQVQQHGGPGAQRMLAARPVALAALAGYRAYLAGLKGLPEYATIGADNYAWRLKHAELLPWTPDQLLALAKTELSTADMQLALLKPQLGPSPAPTTDQTALAASLTRDQLLGLYDAIQVANRTAVDRAGFVTMPPAVGPIRARETPDVMVPLDGDGGSMDPPPPLGDSNVSWWNVEHFHADWPLQTRIDKVVSAEDFLRTSMGPYAAHEGIPGHHLQLSLARLNPDPLRSILADAVQNEGWALYAEDEFWRYGGLGNGVPAHYYTLRSWRYRIRRVFYDVNVETDRWSLQQAADFQHEAKPGKGQVDDDTLRSINWPTQLICYFAGKEQILELKAAYRAKMGAQYSERDFNDRLLAVGSVPYVFVRAVMLGEPVPGIEP